MQTKQYNDLFGNPVENPARSMKDYFLVPPFSIIDTCTREWKERKKRWDALIKDNGQTRQNADTFKNFTIGDHHYQRNKKKVEKLIGGKISDEEFIAAYLKEMYKMPEVSILDACLAEIIVKWFTVAGFKVFDPFAGDTVFGFVSSYLVLDFTGIELRKEQAEHNGEVLSKAGLKGLYVCDTAENMDLHIPDKSQDLIFSCPPYADLEKYSDDPRDLSNMSHKEFFKLLKKILGNTYAKLKDDRFAVIVVSEVRDKRGRYIGLVRKTIEYMERAGYIFYNDIILINQVGTLAIRAGQYMNAGRKVGRRHQNVLVFYKGDTKKIKQEFPQIIPKNKYYQDDCTNV
jgi:hypothetical protein